MQCARLLAALPNDATSCNLLNFIPTQVGYTGSALNLQILHRNPGVTPVELSKDDDVLAAVAAGKGTLEVTATLVRCPLTTSPRCAEFSPASGRIADGSPGTGGRRLCPPTLLADNQWCTGRGRQKTSLYAANLVACGPNS